MGRQVQIGNRLFGELLGINRLLGRDSGALNVGRIVSVLVLVFGLSACGVTDRVGKKVGDTWAGDMLFSSDAEVVLTVDGGNDLNLDESGKPLSVVVRMYQLTTLERYVSVNSEHLWETPEAALGGTLLDVRELTLLPGMGQIERWPLVANAQYIGVAAFFRSGIDSRWKVAFAADAFRKDGIWFSSEGGRVLVDQNTVSVERGVDVLTVPRTQDIAETVGDQNAQPLENALDLATDAINE
ncbi:MAG: hypothetical protein JWP80_1024 [Pseudomonas sp.]|nr:hypothetical protein [Pseudomonas sp.]